MNKISPLLALFICCAMHGFVEPKAKGGKGGGGGEGTTYFYDYVSSI